MTTSHVRTCIWLERDGLDAARFYTSLLPNSAIENDAQFDDMQPDALAGVLVIELTLAGTPFQILQAGPHQDHTDMMSIAVTTETQAETDRLWAALTADGGKEVQCGWLKDRFGVAWQIVPRRLNELLASSDPAKAKAVTEAMLQMTKIDIAALEAAHEAV